MAKDVNKLIFFFDCEFLEFPSDKQDEFIHVLGHVQYFHKWDDSLIIRLTVAIAVSTDLP